MIDFSILASTFGLIFLAELPDKTALATLMMAAHGKARFVFLGSALAFLIHAAIAATGGHWIAASVDPFWLRKASGALFSLYALRSWRDSRLKNHQDASDTGQGSFNSINPTAFQTAFLTIFAAEFGDVTQISTAALSASSHNNALSVFLGSFFALISVCGLYVTAGNYLGEKISKKVILRISSGLFLSIGIFLLLT